MPRLVGAGTESFDEETLTAKDPKHRFGRLIDFARAEPVAMAKHGRPVVIVPAIEEYERLKALDLPAPAEPKQDRRGRNG